MESDDLKNSPIQRKIDFYADHQAHNKTLEEAERALIQASERIKILEEEKKKTSELLDEVIKNLKKIEQSWKAYALALEDKLANASKRGKSLKYELEYEEKMN